MKNNQKLTNEQLKDRAIRFYSRYENELIQIAELLRIKLKQLFLAYTINHKLPSEAVQVTTRVKKLESFLKKLELEGWPQFYYPTEVVKDLIGARVVCWFIDDCYGLLNFIKRSCHFRVADENFHPIKDYISVAQPAGYRALHVFAEITYDRVKKEGENVLVVPDNFLCEIQLRSKLQDVERGSDQSN